MPAASERIDDDALRNIFSSGRIAHVESRTVPPKSGPYSARHSFPSLHDRRFFRPCHHLLPLRSSEGGGCRQETSRAIHSGVWLPITLPETGRADRRRLPEHSFTGGERSGAHTGSGETGSQVPGRPHTPRLR